MKQTASSHEHKAVKTIS